jgi:hypothetical protein
MSTKSISSIAIELSYGYIAWQQSTHVSFSALLAKFSHHPPSLLPVCVFDIYRYGRYIIALHVKCTSWHEREWVRE